MAERLPDGRIPFTSHGGMWDLCLNITRDVMTLQAEGRTLRDIPLAIDRKYGRFGAGTPTPLPPA